MCLSNQTHIWNLLVLKVPAHFQGIVSRGEYLVEGHQIKNSALRMSADGFLPIFCCLFVKKIQNKVSDCFYEITY